MNKELQIDINRLTTTFLELTERAATIGLTLNAITVETKDDKHYSINPYEDTVVEINHDGTRKEGACEIDIHEFYQQHPELLEE
ncbi:hypothetical protein H2359_003516 [Salmonella enterica]|uniref:hypothetical protein n=1 Tax=Enterobacteriaceae TaxID=543 RepID=UPI00126C8F7F|nr:MULTISPECIES: hypothetical protein [Citrobacter]EAY3776750.1 hypothetical protein [Salmonella enterica]ECC3108095.1 hypothetical protein [Salmonella enterica subsp. enterica]ECK0358976.1 hypothetical protein [Salmonella enterica subsp. enterica serovar Urbana]ECO0115421.1 hypothetical protein [Salmonella enterica subsp. enterica serovar Schwarzengrund]EEV4957330.1 hypothetical protein [Salmonella enterica subsp. enterica serovar Muenchen]HCX6035158.1 hypothetical protein [Escherichia coli]